MAVFTKVKDEELLSFLANYNLGNFKQLDGIAGGIENTNYFLHMSSGTYVLTIFERLKENQLPFYLKLMLHYANNDICVPKPIANIEGKLLSTLCGKPATIISKLEGKSILYPSEIHIHNVGKVLANMHQASQSFNLYQPNLRSIEWWQEIVPQIIGFLSNKQQYLLQQELEQQ